MNKIMTDKLPVVTIITVVYNSEQFIEKTIRSVINQSYPNIEYIIIDGGSTDGTLKIVNEYAKYIDYFVSEPDNGLYDAMNKGIKHAGGDYLWFINSGDLPYNETVLSDVFSKKVAFADIYYGETEIIDTEGKPLGMRRHKAPQKLTWKTFRLGMKISHQSIIVKKEIAGLYNLEYKLSADFDWVIKVLKEAKSIENTELILSKFMDGGMTKKNMLPSLKERFHIMKNNYGLIPTVLNHIVLIIKLAFYYLKNKRF
jgi:glycosyltransferase involved in cell wall biosynthesis